jgi:hypothetical protein
MKLDINFDNSISAAMTKIIQDELGEVPIQIMGSERDGSMQIDVDAVITTKQSNAVIGKIGELFSSRSIEVNISSIETETKQI